MASDLSRFVTAQESIYDDVIHELRVGRKTGHWMWFIFPQIAGLGRSETAMFFGIASRHEAEAYLRHPLLGPRLRECTTLMLEITGKSLVEILGSIDAMKFRSSMTLFALVSSDDSLFRAALEKFCDGQPDDATVDLLGSPAA